ncbi:MAG TPA: sensor histidine kinase [Fredinandcohnia sp.]|nr:sensor histidine kinase [Fredinandcohnia sp.]
MDDGRRFAARARALAVLRVPFLLVGLLLWASPAARGALGLGGPLLPSALAVGAIVGAIHATALSRLGPVGRARITLLSLCIDAGVFAVWAIGTGGLRSPLLPIQLLLTGVGVLLFPRPILALPGVGALAAIAWLDRLTPGHHFYDLTVLVLYGGLHLALTSLLVALDRRERSLQAERDRLAKELGGAEERARLSREMHDGLGGDLAALVYQAQLLESLCPEGPAAEESRRLAQSATDALDELRRSLRLLRAEFDLAAAVREHCERFRERTGLELELRVDGETGHLSSEAQLSVFRVLQEALTNVARHARARRVEVELSLSTGGASLRVRDDGVGFAPRSDRPGSYGLRSFRERAERLGAHLALESAPGRGTEIRFSLPSRQEHAA